AVDGTTVAAAGAVMNGDLTTNGILKRTGAATYTAVANASADWDTAHTDRLKWDGGATGLNVGTAWTTLGLGTVASQGAGAVAFTGGTVSGVTFDNVTLSNDAVSGDKVHAGVISNFASTGID